MTDHQFNNLLQRTARALTRHRKLLLEAQDEYVRRYGELPGDHDNDEWIDSFEGGGGDGAEGVTAMDVDNWAVNHGRESYYTGSQIRPKD